MTQGYNSWKLEITKSLPTIDKNIIVPISLKLKRINEKLKNKQNNN